MGSEYKRNILGRKKLFALALVVLMSSSCATTIDGKIFTGDTQEGAFKDAAVNLSYLNDSNTESNYSSPLSEEGEYQISGNLKPGEYLLEVLVPGHEYLSRRIIIDGSKTLDLKVKKMNSNAEKSISTYENLPIGRGSGRAILSAPQL